MKYLPSLLILLSSSCLAATNQIDFTWGRATPLSTIQAGGSSEREGLRGSAWSLDAMHRVSDRVMLGMGSGQFHSSDNGTSTFVPGIQTTISSKVTSTLLMGRVDFGAGTPLTPYLVAGLGWARNSLRVTTDQMTLIDDSRNAVGYMGGIGLDITLGNRFLIGAEARYQGSSSHHYGLATQGLAPGTPSGVSAAVSTFTVGLKTGIKY